MGAAMGAYLPNTPTDMSPTQFIRCSDDSFNVLREVYFHMRPSPRQTDTCISSIRLRDRGTTDQEYLTLHKNTVSTSSVVSLSGAPNELFPEKSMPQVFLTGWHISRKRIDIYSRIFTAGNFHEKKNSIIMCCAFSPNVYSR